MKRFLRNSVALLALAVSTTAFAEVKKDFSTPKAAANTMFGLLGEGDYTGALACFSATTDAEKDLLKYGIDQEFYTAPTFVALRAKFPDEVKAKPMPDPAKMTEYLKGTIELAEEKIDGDKATLTPKATGEVSGPATKPIQLVKVGGEWKLAVVEGRFFKAVTGPALDRKKALLDLIVTGIEDIKAGKYPTMDATIKALQEKKAEIDKKFPAATSPAH